ncbi:MAG TPA: peptidylprolyl isomerase [Candidatus Binatia bacterium]|nr:peptidylprolyl isomerase [Candidatus Binatia bacterium]
MKQLIREPLVQFLIIGAVLFGLYRLPGGEAAPGTSNRIVITAGDIEQMRAIFARQWHRPPTEEDLKGLIAARVQEEALYREALAMGLDRDDTIIRRRLAQKLEFLTEDVSDLGNPTDAELTEFFKEHGDRYQVPSRLSFEHIYFSVGKRGKRAEQDAKNDLARLRAGAAVAVADEMGDAFLLEYAHKRATLEEIDKIFGSGFAGELTKIPLREWQGPIASGYGLHLVKVDEHETSRASRLDAVREQVKRDWLDARRRQIKEAAFKKLRERYEVVVDDKALRAAEIAHSDSAQGNDR